MADLELHFPARTPLATQRRWRHVPHRLLLTALQASGARYALGGELALLLFGYDAPNLGVRIVMAPGVTNTGAVLDALRVAGYGPLPTLEAACHADATTFDLKHGASPDLVLLDVHPRIDWSVLSPRVARRTRSGIALPLVGLRDLFELEGALDTVQLG
ncbi:MAG: hypothetical protein EXR79_09135 [Myxococcales bacterium]|nr:hypothetical protein [Myxococcales bacterium]